MEDACFSIASQSSRQKKSLVASAPTSSSSTLLKPVYHNFKRATTTPMPNVGRVRFYLRTVNGTLTSEAAEEDLGYERHELSPVFHAAHYVISAAREVSEANRE
jgi:hypothetical protein